MIIMIVGVILVISLPNSIQPARNKMWYLFGFRILMGIGIGGDYPMSAAIVAERSSLRNRGRMLGWIFSNQGWVNILSKIVNWTEADSFRELSLAPSSLLSCSGASVGH